MPEPSDEGTTTGASFSSEIPNKHDWEADGGQKSHRRVEDDGQPETSEPKLDRLISTIDGAFRDVDTEYDGTYNSHTRSKRFVAQRIRSGFIPTFNEYGKIKELEKRIKWLQSIHGEVDK